MTIKALALLLLCPALGVCAGSFRNVTKRFMSQQWIDSEAYDSALSENLSPSLLPKDPFHESDNVDTTPSECGIWFAKSTIPGAGLGMFAGRDFEKGQDLLASGDVVTPIIDIEIHQVYKEDEFLWNDYTWTGDTLFLDHEGIHDVHAASPGFGAAVNCILDLINVGEVTPEHDEAGLTRQDPGAGAFSPYHNRRTFAITHIQSGNELFADYGDSWFTSRTDMESIPLKGDFGRAQELLSRFEALPMDYFKSETMLREMWETFVLNSPFKSESRTFSALPKTWNETSAIMGKDLIASKREQHSVSLEWLKDHGVCGDNFIVKPSTLPQAGRGAFAHRALKKETVVAPFPLIHLPDKRVLEMYTIEKNRVKDRKTVIGNQLLLNYCMGHKESTMLLCPYGTLTSLINHNQTKANVKLQWAHPKRSTHEPSWLTMSVDLVGKMPAARLSMELVALRDIQQGEEIFLDYGDEWEMAWQHHVDQFDTSWSNHTAAAKFNADLSVPLKTEFELLRVDSSSYPDNVEIKCNFGFSKPVAEWMPQWEAGTILDFIEKADEYWWPCQIMKRTVDEKSNSWYSVVVTNDAKEVHRFSKVPREAIRFFDRPYTSNMLWRGAFRHDMRVPDELFPEAWRNVGTIADTTE